MNETKATAYLLFTFSVSLMNRIPKRCSCKNNNVINVWIYQQVYTICFFFASIAWESCTHRRLNEERQWTADITSFIRYFCYGAVSMRATKWTGHDSAAVLLSVNLIFIDSWWVSIAIKWLFMNNLTIFDGNAIFCYIWLHRRLTSHLLRFTIPWPTTISLTHYTVVIMSFMTNFYKKMTTSSISKHFVTCFQ